MLKLSTPLNNIKGIGPRFYEHLSEFGLKTVKDLLWHFPSRYEDFSAVKKIADLKINEHATIQGVIIDVKLKRTWRRRMFIVEALIADDSGSIKAVWFNQSFLLSILKKGRRVNLAGKVVSDPDRGISLSHPMYELITNNRQSTTKHTGRVVPVYPETRRVTSKMLRAIAASVLDDLEKLPEPIPRGILDKFGFPEINAALRKIHFPENLKEARLAKKRFAFTDLFLLQLANLRQRLRLSREKSYKFETDIEYIKSLLQKLPFELTQSQKKALWEILRDLNKPHPMNRLLEGDVGSGKTIVAALAAIMVASQNKQTAFMAPTEVLARQHYITLTRTFADLIRGDADSIAIALLTSGEARVFYGDGLESEVRKNELTKKIVNGEIKIIIGTHALIQKSVNFNDLALVIIDEQHRFGVKQRAELSDRTPEYLPHFLSMSATPIPRTLSLTIFGDLDLSVIDELPAGRKNIITKIVAPANREKAYAFIRGQVEKGRQVFVICPRIEPTPADADGARTRAESQYEPPLNPRRSALWEIKAVKEEYEKLKNKIFPDLRVSMLHGKMRVKEKAEIMNQFKNREIDILVSTSVIEVGVDVPNATIMMIEGSERFGLAQLHQFRGRVGRGEHQSFCLLFTDSPAKSTWRRLNSLLEAKNGFELAEKDLEIRGPGEFLGESQTGMPDLAMKAVQNPELVRSAREAAEEILKADPGLKNQPLLRQRLLIFEKEIHLE